MGIPLLLCILLPPSIFLLRMPSVVNWTARHRGPIQLSAKVAALLVLALAVGGGLIAAVSDRILFHDEASVLTIAAAFHNGQPLYPAAQAPVEYGLLYGPATYLLFLPPMFFGGVRIGIYQAWSILALALTLLFVYLVARRVPVGRLQAFAAAALFAIMLSPLMLSVWSIKGDVWVLLFSACGLWASLSLNRWPAAILVAISGAVLVDLKFPLLLLSLLPCILLWQRDRKAHLPGLIAAVLVPSFALLLFAVPGLSLSGYAYQLRAAGHHGFSLSIFFINVPYFLFLLLPSFALLWFALRTKRHATQVWVRHRKTFLLLTAAVFVTAMITGIKRGAGPWHGMVATVPLIFINTELWALCSLSGLPDDRSRLAAFSPVLAFPAIMLPLAPIALTHAVYRHFHDRPPYVHASMPAVEREVLAIVQQHRHQTLQMGYSDTAHYNLTFIRPVLQLTGVPLIFDPDARNEADLLGQPLTAAASRALEDCTIDLWLIPRGGRPFSMASLYSLDGTIPSTPLYPSSFQLAFLAHYHQVPNNENQYFDLWACSRGSSK